MKIILLILLGIALVGTVATLVVGIGSMAAGGNPRRSNKLMQYRVLFQGSALLLFAMYMMFYGR